MKSGKRRKGTLRKGATSQLSSSTSGLLNFAEFRQASFLCSLPLVSWRDGLKKRCLALSLKASRVFCFSCMQRIAGTREPDFHTVSAFLAVSTYLQTSILPNGCNHFWCFSFPSVACLYLAISAHDCPVVESRPLNGCLFHSEKPSFCSSFSDLPLFGLLRYRRVFLRCSASPRGRLEGFHGKTSFLPSPRRSCHVSMRSAIQNTVWTLLDFCYWRLSLHGSLSGSGPSLPGFIFSSMTRSPSRHDSVLLRLILYGSLGRHSSSWSVPLSAVPSITLGGSAPETSSW